MTDISEDPADEAQADALAPTFSAVLVEKVAEIIDDTELGYSLRLTRLVDGVSTYTLTMDGEDHEFEEMEDGYAFISAERRKRQATRILSAVREAMKAEGEALPPLPPRMPLVEELLRLALLGKSFEDATRELPAGRRVGLTWLWRWMRTRPGRPETMAEMLSDEAQLSKEALAAAASLPTLLGPKR